MFAILGRKRWDGRIWAIIEVANIGNVLVTPLWSCVWMPLLAAVLKINGLYYSQRECYGNASPRVSSGCTEPPSLVTPVSCRGPGGSANPWKGSSAHPDDTLRGVLQLWWRTESPLAAGLQGWGSTWHNYVLSSLWLWRMVFVHTSSLVPNDKHWVVTLTQVIRFEVPYSLDITPPSFISPFVYTPLRL